MSEPMSDNPWEWDDDQSERVSRMIGAEPSGGQRPASTSNCFERCEKWRALGHIYQGVQRVSPAEPLWSGTASIRRPPIFQTGSVRLLTWAFASGSPRRRGSRRILRRSARAPASTA